MTSTLTCYPAAGHTIYRFLGSVGFWIMPEPDGEPRVWGEDTISDNVLWEFCAMAWLDLPLYGDFQRTVSLPSAYSDIIDSLIKHHGDVR